MCVYVCSETVLELKTLSSVKGIVVRHDPNLMSMGKVIVVIIKGFDVTFFLLFVHVWLR